jgi:hypothetical protein
MQQGRKRLSKGILFISRYKERKVKIGTHGVLK